MEPISDDELQRFREQLEWWSTVCQSATFMLDANIGRRLLARLDAVEEELRLWKPMTPEEAEAAMDAADAIPMSRDEIDRIVDRITDPAYRPPNTEFEQLAADNRRLQSRLDAAESRAAELQREVERLSLNQRKPRLRELAERSGVKIAIPDVSEYDIQVESMKPFAEDLGVDPC